jgi:hypothetical protein
MLNNNKEVYLIPGILTEKAYKDFLSLLDENAYLEKNPDLSLALKNKVIKSIDEHFRALGIEEIFLGSRILIEGLLPYDNESYIENNDNIKEVVEELKLHSPFEHYLLYGYRELLKDVSSNEKNASDNEYIIPDILRKSIYEHFLSELDRVAYLKKNTDLLLAIENGSINNIDKHFEYTGMEELYLGTRVLMEGLEPYDEALYCSLNRDIETKFSEEDFISGFEH